MVRNVISNEYFDWLMDLLCEGMYSKNVSYKKLLRHLYRTDFTYTISYDDNRAKDGISLRYRFTLYKGLDHVPARLEGPCSVLEMMAALALRCEENFMDDPAIGNRTKQWFWMMIKNLGLNSMYDTNYDREYVNDILDRFLNRDYEPDGAGGLFKIKHCRYDLREIEIWDQLNEYINSIM